MSRGIKFKLYDQEEKLALAFQHHCQRNLGINMDLNMIVKHVFLKYLRDNVDRQASDPGDLVKVSDVVDPEVASEVPQGNSAGSGEANAGESPSTPGDAVAESQAMDDSTAATPR